SGDEVGDGDAELPPEGGVACGDVPDFVSDDEAECREVPVADPDFEQVAGDRHIAAEPVPGGKGVDLAVAGDKVGVRGMRQPEGAGGVEHDLVDFRELVFGDTDTVDALPGVQLSAGEE